MGRPPAECIEIDHPWISNDLMPIYRWIFPSEATDEELSACVRARDDWAIRMRYSDPGGQQFEVLNYWVNQAANNAP